MLWINSDNHDPVLYQADIKGSVLGHVNVTGAKARNWEDVSVGPCSSGSCLFIADIGDNQAKRSSITVYRVPEPAKEDTATEPVQAFRGIYPEGAEDAEAMWVTPDERVYVVTKGETGPVVIYRFPVTARSGTAVELESVLELDSGMVKKRERITDADMSADGQWIVMRTTRTLLFYRARTLKSGHLGAPLRYDLTALDEPRGEGVTMGADGMVYLVGEGGGKGRAGTFAALRCSLPSGELAKKGSQP